MPSAARRRPILRSSAASPAASDLALVQAMASGDRAALGALYDRHVALLFALARRLLRNEREAEDIVHDVFLEAWRQANTFDPSRGTARGWLVLRLRSRAVDRLRSIGFARVQSLEITTLPTEPSVEPVAVIGTTETTMVRRALATLPPEQRLVIDMGYLQGLSLSEIATELRIPPGTIKSRLARALAKLREELVTLQRDPG